MPFRIELLWSDLLVWLLVAGIIGLALYTRKRPHLSAPWVRVGRNASGMAAATVLSAFVLVGLLDSVHYRSALPPQDGKPAWSTELLSLLDRVLEPLRASREKTYSAPLATKLFAKETMQLPDGREDRVFPRLRHGGAHLADPQADRWRDVATKSFRGLALALLLWFVTAIAVAAMTARSLGSGIETAWREIWGGRAPLQWRAVLCALGAVLVVAGPVAALAPHYHVLGTDKVGQDVLYLGLKSIRTGVIIGSGSLLLALPLAVLLGTAAGYFGGRVDDLVQYLYATLNAIPGVLLIAAAVLTLDLYMDQHVAAFADVQQRADLRLTALCLILGATGWIGLCRLLRGEALKLRELEYVQSARALGQTQWRIITRHLWPNLTHLVLLTAVIDFSGLVLAEAVLSYVGVGVDPGTVSWGNMINTARLELAREPAVWWSLAAAFTFMLGLVLPANLLADALRDALDPRQGGKH